jgi:peptide/nickel transport system ATP-binding protein
MTAGTGASRSVPAATVPVLEGRSLVKHFPVHGGRPSGRRAVVHAVDDVSITLTDGSIIAVVGESGSGKSTLARLLARLIRPTSGELLLAGSAVRRRADRAYSGVVQMVLQDPFASLNPVHTVRYHLARPLRIHGSGGALDEQIGGLLERVALDGQFAGKYPHELSGGQRQRVAIARALAVGPRVLLADEPVSMLDVSIRLGVLNLLADLRDRERLAICYITHDIASARYLADEIAVMYAGKLIERGPATEVTDRPAHPYTQLLLAAAPDPDRPEPPVLRGRGAPPSLVTPPSGCRFHPRCPYAMPICSREQPPAIEIASGHVSACWLHAPSIRNPTPAGGDSTAQVRPNVPPEPQPAGHGPAGHATPLITDPDTVIDNRPATSRPGTTEFTQ